MSERVRVMLSEEEVDRRIQEIGEQISKDYEGRQVHLVCVLKGGSFSLEGFTETKIGAEMKGWTI